MFPEVGDRFLNVPRTRIHVYTLIRCLHPITVSVPKSQISTYGNGCSFNMLGVEVKVFREVKWLASYLVF